MSSSRSHRYGFGVLAALFFLLIIQTVGAEEKPFSGVVPAQGPITRDELKIIVIEVRNSLRYQNHEVAIQKNVRDAAANAGIVGPPTLDQIRTTSAALNALNLFLPIVQQNKTGGFELAMVKYSANDPNEVSAKVVKLPQRTIAFTKEQLRPAVQALVAGLLGKNPDPAISDYPQVASAQPFSVLSLFSKPVSESNASSAATQKPPAGKPQFAPVPSTENKDRSTDGYKKPFTDTARKDEISAKNDEQKPGSEIESEGPPAPPSDNAVDEAPSKKGKWDKWYHRGIFGEFGFVMSWCRKNGLCAGPHNGFGMRLRIGIRIQSMVAISISGIVADHKLPLTTNAKELLDVKRAFLFGGVFAGVRFHPIKRFFVDPFIGFDVGHLWLIYASNKELEQPSTATYTSSLIENSLEQVYVRRETVTLKGMTVVPEMGVNFFVAPPLAIGFHLQWLIPFWRKACADVYSPSEVVNSDKVCAKVDKISSTEEMDESLRETLSKKDNLPRFFSIELDLTLLFK